MRLAAAIELGRRSLAPPPHCALYSLESAGRRLAARYTTEVQERLGVLLLDARGRIIAEREVFVGTLHTALVSTRDVLRLALSQHVKGVVVFHNHPSGDSQPSDPDVACTRRLASAAELLDVELLDHLVLAGDRRVSMKYRSDFQLSSDGRWPRATARFFVRRPGATRRDLHSVAIVGRARQCGAQLA